MRQPQSIWLRKALFQVHLWTGLGLGLYILIISVTGSIVVYRNELYRTFTPRPIVAVPSGERLTTEQLSDAAQRAYPGYDVTNVFRARNLDQAVDVWLKRGADRRQRLFDPYTGRDLGDSVPRGIRFVSWLLDLHDNLLYGATGRLVNGAGALFMMVLGLTGAVVWWPGVQSWRRSVTIHRGVSLKRFNWDLHSAVGFWTVAFLVLFGVTGAYLAFPGAFTAAVDFLDVPIETNPDRIGDRVLYWLAYVHFGRFGGWRTKLLWALVGLTPPILFVTGVAMWWSRVVRRRPTRR